MINSTHQIWLINRQFRSHPRHTSNYLVLGQEYIFSFRLKNREWHNFVTALERTSSHLLPWYISIYSCIYPAEKTMYKLFCILGLFEWPCRIVMSSLFWFIAHLSSFSLVAEIDRSLGLDFSYGRSFNIV
jgi:hypothetical protein